MGTFNDHMKYMTANMRACAADRRDALAHVNAETDRVLEDARGYIKTVEQNQQATAAHLHRSLSDFRASLHDQVEEMRRCNQQDLRRMSHELHDRLTKAVERIEGDVEMHLDRCRSTRHDLAADLQQASQTWRAYARH